MGVSFAFISCEKEINKANYDYTQDPSTISSKETLDILEQASDEEIRFKATITSSFKRWG